MTQQTNSPETLANPFVENEFGRLVLKDDAPQWVREWVQAAHDDELPNDWRYDKCELIYLQLSGLPDESPEAVAEYATDDYNFELFTWLANITSRSLYVDEVLTEARENNEAITVFQAVQRAQEATLLTMCELFIKARDANTTTK